MKEEALKLADELDKLYQYVPSEASAMIRRLVEELDEKNYRILELTKRYKALTWNDKQGEPVAWMLTLPDGTHDWILDGNGCEGYIPLYTAPQTKPLSDDEIESIYYKDFNFEDADMVKFARAIEERHGIK